MTRSDLITRLSESHPQYLAKDVIFAIAGWGVRRAKVALFQWVQTPPGEIAPAGSNRSSHGGNEMAEAFDVTDH